MADAIIGNTQLEPSKMDLIAELVQRELRFSAKLVPTVRDLSSFATAGLKSVEFPKMQSFTPIDRVSGAAGDAEALAVSNDVMLLDKNKYIAYIVDSTDEVQSRISTQAELAGRAASAHGRAIDLDILSEANVVANAVSIDQSITEDDVLDMREYILSNEGELSRMTLVIGPAQEKAMLKISRFSNNDIYGRPVIPQGFIGTVHGVTVMVHNGLTGNQSYMWDSEGLGFALQAGPNFTNEGANAYGANARRYAMDQLYGVKGLQVTDATYVAGAGNPAALGESALVAKLF